MWLLRKNDRAAVKKSSVVEVQGAAGWLLGLFGRWPEGREKEQKRLQLVETLALGGKKQLMLVRCGDEMFLVGGGTESIETILRVKDNSACE